MKRTIYRDRKTGRFISKSTWRRSRAHGGSRYRRERVRLVRKKAPPVRPALPPAKLSEFIISFSYDKTGRTFDIISVAPEERGAVTEARNFLRDDATGSRIFRSGFTGWDVVPGEGRPIKKYHPPEYRDESKEE